jgi:putative hydrolase of the HAD superfamily
VTISAVGFDLDETLAIPTRDRTAILAEAIDLTDAPPVTREQYLEAHGQNLTADSRVPIFRDLFEETQHSDPEHVAATYRRLIGEALEPLSGVESSLRRLRTEYQIGLLTNGPRRAQRDKLKRLSWTDLFDVTLITGELEAGKPDAEAFEALIERLETQPANTVFVGDDVQADIEGAAAAGLVPIQVLYPEGPPPSNVAKSTIMREELPSSLFNLLSEL